MQTTPTHADESPATPDARPPAARLGVLVYGLVSYLLFFGTFLYMIGFVAGVLVPKDINDGTPGPLWLALLVDASLVGLFCLQHEVMARPRFKAWLTRYIPGAIERSTFVVLASLILLLMFWQWRPLPGVLWDLTGPGAWAVYAVAALGWGTVLLSTFLINHFDLFGLRQTVCYAMNREHTPLRFTMRLLYRVCRHPLMLGFLIAFWATPLMTMSHLWFASLMTGMIFVGLRFEERDLIREHGEDYLAYRRKVRGVVPLPRRLRPEPAPAAVATPAPTRH
ncbi:MAG: methanethiol S-methyltransferase [Phycisphaerales bacterium JB040]